MDLDLPIEDQDFLSEVQRFLESSLPSAIRRAQWLTPTVYSEFDVSHRFHRILADRGWSAPSWPQEYGGPGWSLSRRYLWQVACAQARAPIISPIGLSLVGPVVMHFGTSEQKEWVLNGIRRGDHYWCQGFSEPGAGSDLASLRTRATAVGSEYVVNGTKIWTTHAHYAQWMIALVRTRDTGRKQEGITVLLVDMTSPGVSIRPIHTIGGDHEVNQVFLDDVHVPQGCRVGEEGEGWAIAKFLLEFERGGDFAAPALRVAWADALALVSHQPAVQDDPDVTREIARVGIELDALEMLELRLMARVQAGGRPGAITSMLKLRASQLQQSVAQLFVSILGESALRWESRRPLYSIEGLPDWEAQRLAAMPRYLNSRANTIFGGSSEIQRSLIAKMVGVA